MSLEERLLADLKQAMKSRDELVTGVLRMLKSQLMLEKTKEGGSRELTEEAVEKALAGYARKLAQAIEMFRQGGREDLVSRHEAELAVVRRYLPEQAGQGEIARVIEEVVAAVGASSPADMGRVMGQVMGRLKGRCDGAQVQKLVSARLRAAAE